MPLPYIKSSALHLTVPNTLNDADNSSPDNTAYLADNVVVVDCDDEQVAHDNREEAPHSRPTQQHKNPTRQHKLIGAF